MQRTVNSEQRTLWLHCCGLMIALTFCGVVRAQEIRMGDAQAEASQDSRKGHVTLLSDSVVLSGAKTQTVELRFRVAEGFHINSHTPKDELLIPTELKLDSANGVVVLGEQYPKGSAFRLSIGEGETLDVYQGEFRVTVKLTAAQGATLLTGSLRYQACDSAACFPPKLLPVKVALLGR
jgi:DsbC/DsbD-like thiol-disulfide interchange protein